MDRLLELEYIIQEISNIESDVLEESITWKETADNVITKLREINLQLSQKYQSTNTLFTINNSLLTPPHSAHSASSTSSIHSDSSLFSDPNYSLASEAFDRQIYSRCVQIVENAQLSGQVEMPLITLAHHSYLAMVEKAENQSKSLKFVKWWIMLLETAESGRTNAEKNEIFEYRLTAFERLYQREDGQQLSTSKQILKLLIQSYENVLTSYRPFHPIPLRWLEHLATWVDELKKQCEGMIEYDIAYALLEEGIVSSTEDRKKFENERSTMKYSISYGTDYALCYDIMKTLSQTKFHKHLMKIGKQELTPTPRLPVDTMRSSEENIVVRL